MVCVASGIQETYRVLWFLFWIQGHEMQQYVSYFGGHAVDERGLAINATAD